MAATPVHQLEMEKRALHGQFSADLAPALTIASGDTVQYHRLPDVAWGLENHKAEGGPRRKVEPRSVPRDDGPCLAGPVHVEGAVPGDVLAVHIDTLVPGAWGWTLAGEIDFFNTDLNRQLGVGEGPPTLLRWTLEGNGEAVDQHGHRVALRPMLGTIGLCPDGDGWHSGWMPRRTGGNLDAAVLTEGSVLYLPVAVEGARVSVGDGHAAQGHGESSGTGIECLMERAALRYVVRPDLEVTAPRAETPRGWVTFGVGDTLDDASAMALQGMLDWLVDAYDLPRKQALALASVSVDLEVTQVVNGVRGAHAVLSTEAQRRLFGGD
jgi:acetamidase/formamidase